MDDWGSAREKRAARGRWWVLAAIALLSGLGAVVLPFVSAGHDVFGPSPMRRVAAPEGLRIAVGIGFTLVLLAAARWNWRRQDEMRRREIAGFWAAIGFTMLAMFPIVHLLGPLLPPETRLMLVYAAALTGGCGFYLWNRVRA